MVEVLALCASFSWRKMIIPFSIEQLWNAKKFLDLFFGIKRSKGYVKEVTVKQNHGSSLFTLCWEVFIGSPKHLQTPLYWILIVANNFLTLTASTNNAFTTFLDKNPLIICFSMRDQNIPNCAMFDKRCNRYYDLFSVFVTLLANTEALFTSLCHCVCYSFVL